ncbi:MAG: class I SAM-dependent methyltransferase [Gammaproteobacteria bacterium]|nr:class I SAM-dependent methyltransferase [Gammaproteobacteria bacterium]
MQIATTGNAPESSDFDLIRGRLPIDGSRLLELGCGAAETTRRLAEELPLRGIVAIEVDAVQHRKNLQIDDLPNVRFAYGGAEAIALPDASVDGVIMLKSLHHVPVDAMDRALAEIARVLRPGGLAYISEPVYAGAFNDILRLFHDEQVVRQAAFDALCRTVADGRLALHEEIHFTSIARFAGFAEFERRVMAVTHSDFAIDATLHAAIRDAFLPHVAADGIATFRNPMRADLLRRPAR